MATISVTVPDNVVLGRNGAIGTLQVDWSKVPQPVLDHIASVYFPQYLTDAANAGGRDESATERLARAQKKYDAMLAGQVRARGTATEPTDPVDLEAFRMAKAALIAFAKTKPEWNDIPKKERKNPNSALRVLDMRAAARGEPERGEWDHYVEHYLAANPDVRKAAERIVRERNKAGGANGGPRALSGKCTNIGQCRGARARFAPHNRVRRALARSLFFGQSPMTAQIVRLVPRPHRVPNAERRPREYLTEAEVDQLCSTARKRGRYGHRDATMILVAFRHGLRVGELVALRWDQVDFDGGLLHVNRLKHGVPSVHPISGKELRGLRQIKREQPAGSRYVFMTERRAPFTTSGFAKMLARIGEAAAMPFPVHPHMLRHACGYKLANDGRDTRALQHYLGHRQIQHTVRYTEMAPGRFNGFWKD